MLEACQRAQTAHILDRDKNVEWLGPLPDIGKEVPLTSDSKVWFRAKSDLAFQRPSTVLVESAVVDGENKAAKGQRDTHSIISTQGQTKLPAILRALKLSSEGFFEFLFSERWAEGHLLRVMPGQLFNNLMHGLTLLERYHEVISYATIAHTERPRIESSMKNPSGSGKGVTIDSSELGKVLVELEFFCLQERPLNTETIHESNDDEPAETVSLSMISGLWNGQDSSLVLPSKQDRKLSDRQSRHSLAMPDRTKRETYSTEIIEPGETAYSIPCSIKQSQLGKYSQSQSFLTVASSGLRTVDRPKRALGVTRSAMFNPRAWPVRGKGATSNISLAVNASPPAQLFLGLSESDCRPGEDPLDFSSEGSICSSGDHEMTRVRCNIRGQGRPSVHDDCLGTYHMVREPFFQRRLRLQSAFPPIEPPALQTHTDTKELDRWNDRWEDDAFLGQILEDSSEMIASDPRLEQYALHGTGKKQSAIFNKHRMKLTADHKTLRDRELKGKGKKKNRQSDSDDDDGFEEDEARIPCNLDMKRMSDFQKDVSLMESEFLVGKLNTKDDTMVSLESSLKFGPRRASVIDPTKGQRHDEVKDSAKAQPSKSTGKPAPILKTHQQQALKSPKLEKRTSDCGPASRKRKRSLTFRGLKRWLDHPDFMYFFYYLSGKDDSEIYPLIEEQRQGNKQRVSLHDTDSDDDSNLKSLPGRGTSRTEISNYPGEGKDPAFTSKPEKRNDDSLIGDGCENIPGTEQRKKSIMRKTTSNIEDKTTQKGNERLIDDHRENVPTKESFVGGQKTFNEEGEKKRNVIWKKNSMKKDTTSTLEVKKINQMPSVPTADRTRVKHMQKQKQHRVGIVPVRTPETDKNGLKGRIQCNDKNVSEQKMKRLTAETKLNHLYLSKEQENKIKNAGLAISDIDPWHIYVPSSSLIPEKYNGVDAKDWLSKGRKKTHTLIDGGKVIMQINKARIWGLTRQVPQELSRKDSPIKNYRQSKTKTKNSAEKMSLDGEINENESQLSSCSDILDASGSRPCNGKQMFTKRAGPGKTALKGKGGKSMKGGEEPTEPTDTKIDEKDLFKMMGIDEVFNTSKLKSSYSFEKMFSHRMSQIPKYFQRLGKYSNPANKQKKSKKQRSVLPPVDRDKSKQDVQKDVPDIEYVQDTHVLTNHFFYQLLKALKLFIVRKERATSVSPMQSRVSITFTRRSAAEKEEPDDLTSLLDDDPISVVSGLCRTLLMDD